MKHLKYFFFNLFLIPSFVFAQSVDYEVGNLKITSLGSASTISMGRSGEIGRFRLSNQGRKNLQIESIQFKNYGTADLEKNFESFILYAHNESVGSASFTEKKRVGIALDDFILERGNSVIFTLKAKLVYAKRGQTIQLGIQRTEDLMARENSSGFYATCENCENTKFKTYSLRTGSIYLQNQSSRYRRYRGSSSRTLLPTSNRTIYSNDRSNRSYNTGSKDVVFFSSFFRTKVSMQAEGVFLAIENSSQVSDKNGNGIGNELVDFEETFSDFRLYVGGEYVDHANNFESQNGQLGLLFETTFEIHSNSQLLLVGRLTQEAQTGDKIKFRLDKNGLIDPVYLHNYDSVFPSGGSSGNFSETE